MKINDQKVKDSALGGCRKKGAKVYWSDVKNHKKLSNIDDVKNNDYKLNYFFKRTHLH